jgi:hypothetical protein
MYHAGQKFVPSASRENEIDRLLRDARAGRLSYRAHDRRSMATGHVLAKNTTGSDLAVGRPALHSGIFTNTEASVARKDWDTHKGYLTLVACNPLRNGDSVGGVGITIEPIQQNQFGIVAISGLAIWLEAVAGGVRIGEYLCPTSTGFFSSDYGFARCVSTFDGMQIVDLSQTEFMAPYTLAAAWNTTSKTASAVIGGIFGSAASHTTTIRDGYGSHGYAYQTYSLTNPDAGMVRWVGSGHPTNGGAWHVVVPYC